MQVERADTLAAGHRSAAALETPNIETPDAETPSLETSGTEAPSAETHVLEALALENQALETQAPNTHALKTHAPKSIEEIYSRVFRQLRPRTPLPTIRVEFRRYANANAQVKLEDGALLVRLADTLGSAPAPVMEALAEILLCKLFRRPIPAESNERYRRHLNRKEVRRSLDLVRQIRGRKRLQGPEGVRFHLDELFEELNFRFFHGMMARPLLGWSPYASRTTLGHYDPSHNAIVLSRILDRPNTPRVTVEYVLFHEMLHLRYPVEHTGSRRRVHTRAFKEAEKQFERLAEAKLLLRAL